jgi:hypothetical protein
LGNKGKVIKRVHVVIGSLLLLITNEYYKTGQYLYAAKAFDGLERMDESPEYWCVSDGDIRQRTKRKPHSGS